MFEVGWLFKSSQRKIRLTTGTEQEILVVIWQRIWLMDTSDPPLPFNLPIVPCAIRQTNRSEQSADILFKAVSRQFSNSKVFFQVLLKTWQPALSKAFFKLSNSIFAPSRSLGLYKIRPYFWLTLFWADSAGSMYLVTSSSEGMYRKIKLIVTFKTYKMKKRIIFHMLWVTGTWCRRWGNN